MDSENSKKEKVFQRASFFHLRQREVQYCQIKMSIAGHKDVQKTGLNINRLISAVKTSDCSFA